MYNSELIATASSLFEGKRFSEALDVFHKAHQLQPKNVDLCVHIAHCLIALGNFENAKNWLTYTRSLDPVNPDVDRMLGDCFKNLGDEENALAAYQKGVRLAPGSLKNLAALALYHSEGFNNALAQEYASKVLSVDDHYPGMNAIMADYYYDIELFHNAILHSQKEIDNGTAKYDDYLTAAMTLMVLKRYEEAAAYYNVVASQEESSIALDGLAGEAYAASKLGDLESAVKSLRESIGWVKDGGLENALGLFYITLVDCYHEHGKFQDALAIIAEAENLLAKQNFYYSRLFITKCDLQLALQQTDAAISTLHAAISAEPGTDHYYRKLAEILYHTVQNVPSAIEFYEQAIGLDPRNVRNYLGIATLYRYEGQWDTAIQYFERAQEVNANHPDVIWVLAMYHQHLDQYDQALKLYQQIINVAPESAIGFEGVATCYFQLKVIDKAEQYYIKAHALAGSWIMPYYGIGKFYQSRGDSFEDVTNLLALRNYQKAKQYFDEGLSLDKEFAPIHLQIAKLPMEMFADGTWNPVGHLLRSIFLTERSRYNFTAILASAREILELLTQYDLPLAPYQLLRNDLPHGLEGIHLPSKFDRLNSLTEPFRILFYLWNGQDLPRQLVSNMAIMRYHLGDPIECFRIYRDQHPPTNKKPIDHYYFALAADAILEPHQEFLIHETIPAVKQMLGNKNLIADHYYISELLEMAGDTASAKNLQQQLVENNFFPSLVIEQFKKAAHVMPGFETLIASALIYESPADPIAKYFKDPDKIELDLESNLLPQIEHLLYYLEVSALTGESNYELFSELVDIKSLNNINRETFIKNNFPHKHEVLYGKVENEEWIIRKIKEIGANSWDVPGKLFNHLADELHTQATAQLDDLQKEVKDFRKVNYKNYIFLANELMKKSLLDEKSKAVLQHYTIYCAKAIDAFTPNYLLEKPAMDELISSLDSLAMFFIHMPLMKVLAVKDLLVGLYFRRFGKEREILQIDQFVLKEWES